VSSEDAFDRDFFELMHVPTLRRPGNMLDVMELMALASSCLRTAASSTTPTRPTIAAPRLATRTGNYWTGHLRVEARTSTAGLASAMNARPPDHARYAK
jgi:hypothetical protein